MRESSTPDDLLHSIVNSLPARIFWKDTESRYLGCNMAFARDAGLDDPREIVGRTDFEMPWRSEASMYREHDREVLTTGVPELGIEEPQTTPEGGRRWLSTSKVPLRDRDQNVVGVIGIYEDVTDRWKAEVALRESEARNRSIIGTAMDGFWLATTEGRIVEVNEAYCRMSGYSRTELLGMSIVELDLTLEGDPYASEAVRQVLQHGQHRFETRHRRKDGSMFDVEVSVQYRPEATAQLIMFLRDITEGKRAAEALRASEERHRTIIQTAMDGFWRTDGGGNLLEVNEAYCRMSGHRPEELLGRNARELSTTDSPEDPPVYIRRAVEQGEARFEARHFRKDGTSFDADVNIQYRPWDGGQFVAFQRDITERKHAEEQLRQSLKEKEGLLREVHHRVKNNLQVISSLLRLETSRSDVADTQRVLHDMQGRILSMAVLHETLYRSGRFGQVELGAYLRQLALQLFRATAGAARLNTDMTPVSVELDQAIPCGLILNELLTNSLKHAFQEGLGGEVRVSLAQDDSGEVTLTVADTGVGLPPDFETRKSRSLGLQLVTDLVRQIGGRLAILPGPGAGFVVTFTPIAAHATSAGPPSGGALPSP